MKKPRKKLRKYMQIKKVTKQILVIPGNNYDGTYTSTNIKLYSVG